MRSHIILKDAPVCPFCSTHPSPEIKVKAGNGGTVKSYRVRCRGCGANTPWCQTSKEALKQWDRYVAEVRELDRRMQETRDGFKALGCTDAEIDRIEKAAEGIARSITRAVMKDP